MSLKKAKTPSDNHADITKIITMATAVITVIIGIVTQIFNYSLTRSKSIFLLPKLPKYFFSNMYLFFTLGVLYFILAAFMALLLFYKNNVFTNQGDRPKLKILFFVLLILGIAFLFLGSKLNSNYYSKPSPLLIDKKTKNVYVIFKEEDTFFEVKKLSAKDFSSNANNDNKKKILDNPNFEFISKDKISNYTIKYPKN